MKIAIYCRVSTEKQALDGVSIFDQKQRGIEFCNKHKYEYEVFEEPAISGSKDENERPALFELMQRTYQIKGSKGKILKKTEFDGVYVSDFDRISRNPADLFRIKEHFLKNEIQIFDKGISFDLNDITTSFLFDINGALSAYELKHLKERVKRALESSISQGNVGGGPLINYGYCKGENKKLIINQQEAEIVELIYDLCIKGDGTRTISKKLNQMNIPTKRNSVPKGKLKVKGENVYVFSWKPSVVYKILTNSIYCGERVFKNKIYNSPPIIEKQKFLLVKEILKERKRFVNTTNKYNYLLKGLILCPICKNLFFGFKRSNLKDNHYKCCSGRYSNFCGNRGINIDKIDRLIWNQIIELPNRMKNLLIVKKSDYINSLRDEINKIEKNIERYTEQKNVLIRTFKNDPTTMNVIKGDIEEISRLINNNEKELEDKKRQFDMSSQHKEIVNNISNQINSLKKMNFTFEEKQRIVRSYISFIIVKWSNNLNRHLIWTQFRFSELSDLSIQGLSKVSYKKYGFVYKEDKVAYEYRIGDLKPVININNDGSKNIDFIEESDDFFTIEDFTEKEFINFRELIRLAKKRKNIKE